MSVTFVPEEARISVARYQAMVAAGVLTKADRVELIDGKMVDMAPIGSKHVAPTARLTKLLVLAAADAAIVSPGGPVNLGEYSEPQPDLQLLKPRDDYYAAKIPEAADVLLLIEISDSSLAFDQSAKLALYARHGIEEYWIVDIQGQCIQVQRQPTVDGYSSSLRAGLSDVVSPQALPALRFLVKDLFV